MAILRRAVGLTGFTTVELDQKVFFFALNCRERSLLHYLYDFDPEINKYFFLSFLMKFITTPAKSVFLGRGSMFQCRKKIMKPIQKQKYFYGELLKDVQADYSTFPINRFNQLPRLNWLSTKTNLLSYRPNKKYKP